MPRLYIAGLGPDPDRRKVEKEFQYYGELDEVWLSKRPFGYAFIEYIRSRDGEFVCLFVCLLVCLSVFLFVCLFPTSAARGKRFRHDRQELPRLNLLTATTVPGLGPGSVTIVLMTSK